MEKILENKKYLFIFGIIIIIIISAIILLKNNSKKNDNDINNNTSYKNLVLFGNEEITLNYD